MEDFKEVEKIVNELNNEPSTESNNQEADQIYKSKVEIKPDLNDDQVIIIDDDEDQDIYKQLVSQNN